MRVSTDIQHHHLTNTIWTATWVRLTLLPYTLGFMTLTIIFACLDKIVDDDGTIDRFDPVNRNVINPGEPAAAKINANSLLKGPDFVFSYLFRMDKRTFKRLCLWLRLNTNLAASRYQTVEHKG